jgi:hypothetical protein
MLKTERFLDDILQIIPVLYSQKKIETTSGAYVPV